MKKWLLVLGWLTLVIAITTGATFAMAGDGSATPGDGGLITVTSIDDIDPNECNWIHNITACESQ